MAFTITMHLRPFLLLTACLLGACEKRDAAPGSHPPGIASTKSSLRDTESESPVIRRDLPSGRKETFAAIRSWVRDLNRGNLTGEEPEGTPWRFHTIIKGADPADFDLVWKMLGELEDPRQRREFQITAIHYLSARRNLVAAGRTVSELLFPEVPEEEQFSLLGKLMAISSPTLPETVDFLREFGSVRKREVVSQYFPLFTEDRYNFMPLKEANYRLNLEESGVLLAGLIWTSAGLEAEEASGLLSTITSLEGEGVFAKGTREALLLEIARVHPKVFFQILSPEQVENRFRQEGYDEVIRTIINRDLMLDPFSDNGFPHTFFTPTGTHNLPPEKIPFALESWHSRTAEDAEKWFAANGEALPPNQQDLIRADFANNEAKENGAAAARQWIDQISDPALREKTSAELPSQRDK